MANEAYIAVLRQQSGTGHSLTVGTDYAVTVAGLATEAGKTSRYYLRSDKVPNHSNFLLINSKQFENVTDADSNFKIKVSGGSLSGTITLTVDKFIKYDKSKKKDLQIKKNPVSEKVVKTTTPKGPPDSSTDPAPTPEPAPAPAPAPSPVPPADATVKADDLTGAAAGLVAAYNKLKADAKIFPTLEAVRVPAVTKADAWSMGQHTVALYSVAKGVNEIEPNSNLAQFIASVERAPDDSSGITRGGLDALRTYFGNFPIEEKTAAVKDYTDVRGEGFIERSLDMLLPSVFAVMSKDLADLKRLKSEKESKRAESASGNLLRIHPGHDSRDKTTGAANSKAAVATITGGLNVRMITNPDDVGEFGMGPAEVVLSISADPSSFADRIKELPGLFGLGAARTRRKTVGTASDLKESFLLEQDAPGAPDATFGEPEIGALGVLAIPEDVPPDEENSYLGVSEPEPAAEPEPPAKEEPPPPAPEAPPEAPAPPPARVEISLQDPLDLDVTLPAAPPRAPATAGGAPAPAPTPTAPKSPPPPPISLADPLDLDVKLPQAVVRRPAEAPAPVAPAPEAPPPPAPVAFGDFLPIPDAAPVETAAAAPPAPVPDSPQSIAPDCASVKAALKKDYEIWDLLSFRSEADNKYYIANAIDLAFSNDLPSVIDFENLTERGGTSSANSLGLKIRISYSRTIGSRTFEDAFLSREGTGGTGARRIFGDTASVRQGALKFIECFLVEQMITLGFFTTRD